MTEVGTDLSDDQTVVSHQPVARAECGHQAVEPHSRESWLSILLIIAAVVAAHAPVLFGWLDPNPIHVVGNVDARGFSGVLPGLPFIDPNIGVTSQALGHRSMLDWISGAIPWWNPYEGVGSPLAGGFQSAAFFPPTLLTLFANGQLFLHLLLETTAGISTFFLARELGLRRSLSTLCGVLFALNGTFAWMGHAPANPIAFLPMLLLGIERTYRASQQGRRAGWLLIPLAVALSLLAGFPETAYIDGLLAALWFITRLVQSAPVRRVTFLLRCAAGGTIGLLLAAPLLVAVYDYLPNANIGIHAHIVDDALSRAATPLLAMPYAFGPIDAFIQYDPTGTIANLWGGGYLTTSLLFLALVGLVGPRQRGLRLALAGWATFGLMRTMGVGFVFEITKAIPFLDRTFFSGYSVPSWELAVLLLAVFGLDDLFAHRVRKRWIVAAAVVSLTLTALAIRLVRSYLHFISGAPGHELAAKLSSVWAVCVIVSLLLSALLTFRSTRIAASLMCVIVLIDVGGMFVIPELSNPRSGQVDVQLVDFLQHNLGTNRFYTFGPIAPDYGSYFGIASINVNDVPVPKLWTQFIASHLDTNAPPLVFTGYSRVDPTGPTATQEFREHIANYAWVGVKYVVTAANSPDIVGLAPPGRLRPVYNDGVFEILRLAGTAPLFQAPNGDCTVQWSSWNDATSRCARASQIVRRELYMPGWSVAINGKAVQINEYKGLFESVEVPAGTATLSFRYSPAHEFLGIGALFLGLLALSGSAFMAWKVPRMSRRRGRYERVTGSS